MPRAYDDGRSDASAAASTPLRPGRRAFLRLAAGTAVLGVLHPLVGRRARVVAAAPGPQPVHIEDLVLRAEGLRLGTLQGLTARTDGIGVASGRASGRYVSPILEASSTFTHVGLHWSGDEATGIQFEVRSAPGAGGWSAWQPLLLEPHVPEGATETFAALVAGHGHERVQFRAAFAGNARSGPVLREATVTLINTNPTGDVFTSSTLGVLSDGGFNLPDGAVTREAWNVGTSPHGWTRAYVPVKKVVVHHTATTNNYSEATAPAEVRAIWAYHANTLGWGDIGYNALVDRFGNVYEGRQGRDGQSREILGPEVVAGHALGHNYGTTGVALLGTFTAQGDGGRPGSPPSAAMWEALVNLVAWECDRHHINPLEATDFLRTDAAWNRSLPNIPGHRDCVATICPGGHIYSRLGDLRAAVADRLQRESPSVALTAPTVESVDASNASELDFSWSAGGGSGFAYLLEGWRRHESDPDAIHVLSGHTEESRPDWRETDATAAAFGALFEEFGRTAQIEPGHYTFHVRALDGGASGYAARTTLLVTGEPSSPPATGGIAGTVSGPGGTIVGATVSVEGTSFEATTGGDGSYAIDGVPEATYDVTASAEGFEPQTKEVQVTGAGTATLSFELVTEESDDPPSDGISIDGIEPDVIAAGATIAVTISGSGFAPGAAITIENGQGPQPSASGVQVENAQTITASVSVSGGGPPRDRPWDVRVTNPDGSSAVLPGGLTVRR